MAQVNTTDVPKFKGTNLYAPVDLTLRNMASNKTNPEVENDNLPYSNIFEGKANITFVVSSNMLNALLWVLDDSKVLNLDLTTADLGPNPPIELNTLNLSILLPGLKKWPHKGTCSHICRRYCQGGPFQYPLVLVHPQWQVPQWAQCVRAVGGECDRQW